MLRKCEKSFPDHGLPVTLHFVSLRFNCVYSNMTILLFLIS